MNNPLFALLMLLTVTSQSIASLRYQFSSFTGFDPGWSFDGGFVEISGPADSLPLSDFIDWDFDVTLPGNISLNFTPANSTIAGATGAYVILTGTPTELTWIWNQPPGGGDTRLAFYQTTSDLFFDVSLVDGPLGLERKALMGMVSTSYRSRSSGYPEDYPIATRQPSGAVPEPSSILVWFFLGIAAAPVLRRRLF